MKNTTRAGTRRAANSEPHDMMLLRLHRNHSRQLLQKTRAITGHPRQRRSRALLQAAVRIQRIKQQFFVPVENVSPLIFSAPGFALYFPELVEHLALGGIQRVNQRSVEFLERIAE